MWSTESNLVIIRDEAWQTDSGGSTELPSVRTDRAAVPLGVTVSQAVGGGSYHHFVAKESSPQPVKWPALVQTSEFIPPQTDDLSDLDQGPDISMMVQRKMGVSYAGLSALLGPSGIIR